MPLPNNADRTMQILDPQFTTGVVKEYDYDRKFNQYLHSCRKEMPNHYDFEFRGAQRLKVLDEAVARQIAGEIDGKDRLTDKGWRREVVEAIIPAIHERMESYFQSRYVPLWMRFYRNMPGQQPDPSYSFYWHCDAGPSRHLKLLLYLNPSEESGSTTLCLDRFTTNEFKDIGYVFCPLEYRLTDLNPIAEAHGLNITPIDFKPESGDGILFEPFNILHKGIWPTKKARYLVQLCFMCSRYPWQQSCDRRDLPREDNAWPTVEL